MVKKITNSPKPTPLPAHQPLWMFKSGSKKMSYYLDSIERQVGYIMRNMTADMRDILVQKQQKQEYSCKICGKMFQKACALGGHMSKSHPEKGDESKPRPKSEQVTALNSSNSEESIGECSS